MRYTILQNRSNYDLIKKVNEYIELGWKPLGGISVSTTSFHEIWAQAMIKE